MPSDYDDDDDDQLTQEDALIDRGVDDLLDEGYSPPDKWKEPKDNETLDELLAEEEPDPAMQLDDPDAPTSSRATTRSATNAPAAWSRPMRVSARTSTRT